MRRRRARASEARQAPCRERFGRGGKGGGQTSWRALSQCVCKDGKADVCWDVENVVDESPNTRWTLDLLDIIQDGTQYLLDCLVDGTTMRAGWLRDWVRYLQVERREGGVGTAAAAIGAATAAAPALAEGSLKRKVAEEHFRALGHNGNEHASRAK
mmetsp:Transcript_154077/g.493880  ORF Transcript_154077/g.493880 Transcript_154077/m.493880 type:complete len:156 (+) Transcript_154077:924-1391(+)